MSSPIRRVFRWVRAKLERIRAEPDVQCLGNAGAPLALIFTEQINATYFIYFDVPMRGMHSSGAINFAAISQSRARSWGAKGWKTWAQLHKPDVVILTRYGQDDGLEVLDYFRKTGIRVVYHIDDDLLNVPDHLGVEIAQRHGLEAVVQTRTRLLQQCDVILASTSPLQSLLSDRFPSQKVLQGPNVPYLRPLMRTARPGPQEPAKTVIGYMGSRGHARDLELVIPAIERLLDERPDLHFELFGTIVMPTRLTRFGPRVRSHSVRNSYIDFLNNLAALGWMAGIAPLEDIEFNRCKTPTKYVEYTAAGIPVVASRRPVYGVAIPTGAGVLIDASPDWYTALAQILDQPGLAASVAEQAHVHCTVAHSLEAVQSQLLDLLDLR